jgi:hypothetical protein
MPFADFSLRLPKASPFQAQGEISLGKMIGFPCTIAGFTPLHFGHKSFAAICQLALFNSASYPISVRRLAVSVHASFRRSLTVPPLRFPSVPVARSRKNFHLQVNHHARHTKKRRPVQNTDRRIFALST